MNIKYIANLPRAQVTWLREYAQEHKQDVHKVLADLIEQKKKETATQDLREKCKQVAQDPDFYEPAEWGMGEYGEDLVRYEQEN